MLDHCMHLEDIILLDQELHGRAGRRSRCLVQQCWLLFAGIEIIVRHVDYCRVGAVAPMLSQKQATSSVSSYQI